MTRATISTKGQIAIPEKLLEQLDLKEGTQVSIDVQGEALVIKRLPVNDPDWRTMRGMLQDSNLLQDLADERAASVARDNASVQGR